MVGLPSRLLGLTVGGFSWPSKRLQSLPAAQRKLAFLVSARATVAPGPDDASQDRGFGPCHGPLLGPQSGPCPRRSPAPFEVREGWRRRRRVASARAPMRGRWQRLRPGALGAPHRQSEARASWRKLSGTRVPQVAPTSLGVRRPAEAALDTGPRSEWRLSAHATWGQCPAGCPRLLRELSRRITEQRRCERWADP